MPAMNGNHHLSSSPTSSPRKRHNDNDSPINKNKNMMDGNNNDIKTTRKNGKSSAQRSFCIIFVGIILLLETLIVITSLTGDESHCLFGSSKKVETTFAEWNARLETTGTDKEMTTDPLARVWSPWNLNEFPLPCFPAERSWWTTRTVRSPTRTGLLFIRNMKTGSSTIGGITLRISHALARKLLLKNKDIKDDEQEQEQEDEKKQPPPLCKVRFDHTRAFDLKYRNRIRGKSFLFSFVRDPTRRAISEFFHFGVSRFKLEPSDANFQNYLLNKWFLNNYFLFDMSMNKFNVSIHDKAQTVAHIMNDYDFIGVTERMDESLVVMKILLHLDYNDILYLSAKGSGGFDDGAYNEQCHYIVPSYVSPGMKEFFASPRWQERIRGDAMLVQAVNRSLDMTITSLGRHRVYQELQHFQRLKRHAQSVCLDQTIFPCTSDGVLNRFNHSCLWWDSGCGYHCLDQIGNELPRNNNNNDDNEDEEDKMFFQAPNKKNKNRQARGGKRKDINDPMVKELARVNTIKMKNFQKRMEQEEKEKQQEEEQEQEEEEGGSGKTLKKGKKKNKGLGKKKRKVSRKYGQKQNTVSDDDIKSTTTTRRHLTKKKRKKAIKGKK